MKGNLSIQIKNIRDLEKGEKEGTIIGPEVENFYKPTVKAISFQKDLSGVYIVPRQIDVTSVNAKIFGALSDNKVDARYVSMSGSQISILMPKEDVKKAIDALLPLDVVFEVDKIKGTKGTFSIVGSGMRGRKGTLSEVTGVLARYGINIEQAVQPNSENIIRFSVDDRDIPLAVLALYSDIFK
jgi:aspartokinase